MKSTNSTILFCCAVATLAFSLISCGGNKSREATNAKLTKVTLLQEWTPNSNFCGAVFGAKKFAEKHGITLDIKAGDENIDPIKLVLSGDSMFGDAAADKVVAANTKGADLVIIGILNNASPTCFLAKKEMKIESPFDFRGKRVGVLSGTSTEYVYRALLSKLKIDKSSFTEVEADFDLRTFITGSYDVRPAFIYDEPVSLDHQKIEYTIIQPEKYGVSFLGTVYFTTSKLISEHPEIVQQFINTVADGWRATLKHPEIAIELLAESYPGGKIDARREFLALQKSTPYFAGHEGKPLMLDPNAWSSMIQSLEQLGVVSRESKQTTVEMKFVNEYYAKNSAQ